MNPLEQVSVALTWAPALLTSTLTHCPNPVSTSQAWERLEKAEHERELALRTELIRQEKLEQLAARFDRKAAMRETWLSENQRLVSQVGLMFQAHPGWWGEMGERQYQ